MDYESEQFEADYWQGVMVITDKATGQCGNVSLRDSNGRNVTLSQFKSCVNSHGVDKALQTYARLVTWWQ